MASSQVDLTSGNNNGKQRKTWRGCLVVLGGVLIHMTLGANSSYTFGQLGPYLTSYIRERSKPADLTYGDIKLLFAVAHGVQALLMPWAGLSEWYFGAKGTALIGALILTIGVMCTYLTIQISFNLVVLTSGAIFGIGLGLAYIPPWLCVVRWFPARKGFVTGIVVAGYAFGAFLFGVVEKFFINPSNLPPDKPDPNDPYTKYYSQDEILDQVPYTYLLLAGLFACCQILGTALIDNPPGYKIPQLRDKSNETTGLGRKKSLSIHSGDSLEIHGQSDDPNVNSTDSTRKLSAKPKGTPREPDEKTPLLSTSSEDRNSTYTEPDRNCNTETNTDPVDPKSSGKNLTPAQILATRPFWTLWFIFAFITQTQVMITSFFRNYADEFINDDNYLLAITIVSSLFSAQGRVIWGKLSDTFPFKNCMIILCSVNAVFVFILPYSPAGGLAVFFIWLCIVFFTFTGVFSVIPAVTARIFGETYMGMNYGLVFTSTAISSIIGAYMGNNVVDQFGWGGLFLYCGIFSFLAMLLSMTFDVKTEDGKDI
ncbi:apicoplast pyruvate carrier 1-like [Glandiceps talaboti]